MKEKLKEWTIKLAHNTQKFIKTLFTIAVIVAALTIGFLSRDYYDKLTTKPVEIKNSRNTSVALNEYNQLIIIDKQSNKYVIYTDTVGKNIFNMYINQIAK